MKMKAQVKVYCEGLKIIKKMCKNLEEKCDEAICTSKEEDAICYSDDIWGYVKAIYNIYGFWNWD